ncbi:MAG: type VII secretion-associated serine protease mycosin [Pseudonocardiales bacterium]|nr:MAG: type VII secretion-associated serine protease mycosin [Pseudonocardiales bacterium]
MPTWPARIAVVSILVAAALAAPAAPATAKPPAGACLNAQPGGPPIRQQPWADKALAPERAWPFSRGAKVLVAVIDSGVDYDHPQLLRHGKVLDGFDFIRNQPRADFDCVSHGTAVASIIAADEAPGIGFHGVAPDARILPVRVSDTEPGDDRGGASVNPTVFAQAIRYAADHGARVINLSVVMYADVPAVRRAVAYAQDKDVVVVAAVGNAHRDTGRDPTPYPAAYPGVLGVGAITIDGSRLPASQVGPYVDLVAPGGGVLAATREHGHVFWDGTSFATPFVSGAAALVRAAWPSLSAAGVARRLLATTSPARGGENSMAYGSGVVDPYRAVTDGLGGVRPAGAAPPLVRPGPDRAALRRAADAHRLGASAGRLVLFAGLAVLGVLGVAAAAPRGRRRRWSASRAQLPE